MSVYDDLPQIAAASLKSTATIHRHSMQSSAAACHMELGLEASIAAQVGIRGHIKPRSSEKNVLWGYLCSWRFICDLIARTHFIDEEISLGKNKYRVDVGV